MSRKKKIIICVLILLVICVLVISAFTFFHIPMSITESNLFKVFVKQTEESETAMLQRKTDDVKEESLDEISESNVQSSSDKTEEQPETEEYSTIPEGASDVSDLPLTKEPVKLSDIYSEKGSDVVFRCFDKDAQSYEWEYYDLSKRMWTAAPVDKILSQKDELHRMVSCFKVKAKEENHDMMLRCIIHYENREDDVQTASLYVLRKSIKEIKVDDVVTDANSYMDAIKLPVCVIYEDGSTDTIIGLNNLYFLVTEEQIDYSTKLMDDKTAHVSDLQHIRAELTALIADLCDYQQNFVVQLAHAVDAKGGYTVSHSQNTADLARQICRAMGLNEKTTDLIYYAGLLQNIGKITLPEKIFATNGKLSAEDFKKIQNHSNIGVNLLMNINFLSEVVPYINYQKERVDGSGEPEGLKGQSIPLGSRIIAVADAFCAMTSDRPYRKAMPREKALSIMKEEAGKKWDVDVVNALAEVEK